MFFLQHLVDVMRLQTSGTNGRLKTMQPLNRNVACLVLPAGASTTIQNEMQLGRAYEVHFAPDADIKVGDRLLWNGTNLSVRYVRPYIDLPPVSHLEALCEQEVD